MPYQALPPIYVQNASLEIAWTRVVFETRTIAGDVLVPFSREGYEGFDINDPHDWMIAERLLADGAVALPTSRRSRTDGPCVGRPERPLRSCRSLDRPGKMNG